MQKITMLGTGLIGMFYTMSIHGQRSRDRVVNVYSRNPQRAEEFAGKWGIGSWSTELDEAINHPESDVVIVALPNFLHKEAILKAVEAGKSVLCTKPLAMSGQEAKEILEAAEKAGVFHGYLEDLVYTPKTLKSLAAVKDGALGRILWTRSREAHPGPHSDWFWDAEQSGGGAIIDMGCHCIEIGRNFIGKDVRPVEVMCWADTQVKPIDAEDHALGWVKYANGAIGQFEVSWTFRGGMDLRDEVSGTEGTIRLDHFLRTGFEMYTSGNRDSYVAEKAETEEGWIFPVGDEVVALGYNDMFTDMFNALEQGKQPMETFYDGYVVNCIMDACYRSAKSKKWEPVELEIWRGKEAADNQKAHNEFDEKHWLIKEERLPDGRKKVILKNKESGKVSEKVMEVKSEK
ncbi:MAG: gfo/Idh/MocA family oxidoreductase [Balneolaceae bacterium]|nr:MAG: gfo/Idh/MocA family oxidoreductase [Balneolaceae bacterium]